MSNIKFISNRSWLNKESDSCPQPISKTIPEWFRKADRFAINPYTNEPWINPQDGGKVPTWKACPAIFDVMASGYALRTPCDIEFYIKDEKILVKVLDSQYQDFCGPRDPMPQFEHPQGYHKEHFAWWMDWAVEVPEGYSVLYTHPMNRFELPFLSTSGIVDNDKVNMPGTMPFFIKLGWTGIIKAGTVYSQVFPFKRESWNSDIVIENPNKLYQKNMENMKKYRVPDGGVYKNEVWEKRSYS
jgi:hypothetical protein